MILFDPETGYVYLNGSHFPVHRNQRISVPVCWRDNRAIDNPDGEHRLIFERVEDILYVRTPSPAEVSSC